jgi:hypothetical protein
MDLRGKTYIFIILLSLIAILIAGMYFELISRAIVFDHPQVSVLSNLSLAEIIDKNESDAAKMPERFLPSLVTDPLPPTSSYPPPPATDQGKVPYPASP